MEDLTSLMQTALTPRTTAASISRIRSLVWEVYESSYLANGDGQFDPADAIALWAKGSLTWLGRLYQRRIVSHSAIEQFIGGKFNNASLTIENADRYLSAFILTNNVNGMRLVARYVPSTSTTLADSVVRFVGRLEAPAGDLDREQGNLTAQEELASLDIEIPRRKVSPEDPEGRSPNDPKFEGFLFNARPSQIKFNDPTIRSGFLGIPHKKDVIKYNQWSSVSETDGAVVPLILGRVQRQGMPVFWSDIGFFITGIWVYSGHKITSIHNFQLPDSNYVFYGPYANEITRQAHVHLGDIGGTGTNASPDTIENTYPQNTAILSRTGYVGFYIGGPESASQPFANPQMDSVATLVAIVSGECDLPDGDGVFNQKGFSDSGVYLARFVLTAQEFFGLDPALVYDGELPAVNAERQRPVIDKSNGEFLALMSHDASALLDGRLTRLNSTGLIDARYFRHIVDAAYPDPLITSRDDVYSVQPGGDAASGGDQQFSNGVGIAGQTVATSAWKYYYIDTPVGADQLQITATGSGDGASFMKLGSKPTLTDFDTFAYTASPQVMTIANPTAGRWWIGIAGFQPDGTPAAGLSYSIIAVYTNGAVGNVLPMRTAIRKAFTLNVPLTDTTNAIDFFNNVVLASFRGYRITDSAGRQRIRARKASDSAYLMSAAAGGTAATGTATLNTLPATGDTITPNGVLFTFRTAPTTIFEILIGATVSATVDTLVNRLNASTDPLLSGATYVNSGGGVLTVTHDVGADGNSFTLAKVSSHITLSGATLSGGTDGDTSISVANVEPWLALKDGYVLISVGLTTSETRKVTTAVYNATVGNAVTLAVSDASLTRSGATLSGGSTSVAASGTVAVSSLAAVDTVLIVTVFGIPISYTISANDDVNSIAGMLTASINADPNLRQYVRAVWNGAHLVTIYCTIGTLGFALGLANAHPAQVASPLTAPTASSTTSGTLVPGNYYLGYSFVDGSGNETLMSPLRTIAITSSHKVSVSSLGALPTGAAEVNWYFSPAHDDDHVQFLLTNVGGSFTIDTVPDPDSDFPPGMNTTGGETIRVMEVFNERNIRKDTFKWVPSQSQTNQLTGTIIDAANGFKPQPITVNDIAHQRAVRKINKKEINLSGVDNFSQGSRLLYAALAEERDAGERWKWATDDAGIPLEIGDVVCINANYVDPSGTIQKEFVNVPVMLESTSLQEDFDVDLVGIFYSTSLLEGQTGRKPVVIPTTLKYATEPPPVATNLTLTQAESFFTGILVDFDFGSWAHAQLAHVFMKGPSFVLPAVEPDDSTYKLIDTVYPDGNNHGHLEIRATSAGTYWIKVETQSVFGRSAVSGHPADSILIRPPAPTGLTLLKFSSNDRALTWQPAVEGAFLPETYIVRVKDSGSSALKRTATIVVGDHSLPAKWTYSGGAGDQSKVTINSDGTISAVPSTVDQVYYDSQVFYGNGDIEFEVDDRLIFNFALFNDGTTDIPAHVDSSYARGAGAGFIQFVDVDATSAWRRRLRAGTKITLRIRNHTIEYRYDDTFWAFAGLLSPPPTATFFLRAYFLSVSSDIPLNEDQAYVRVRFIPLDPRQWVYSDGMAKQDFSGSNPSTVTFEVTQISASGIESLPATVTG